MNFEHSTLNVQFLIAWLGVSKSRSFRLGQDLFHDCSSERAGQAVKSSLVMKAEFVVLQSQ